MSQRVKLCQVRLNGTPGIFSNVYDSSAAYLHAGGHLKAPGELAGWLESLAARVGNWLKLWAKRTTYHCHLSRRSNHSGGDDGKLIYTILVSPSNSKNEAKRLPLQPLYLRLEYNRLKSHLYLSNQAGSIDGVHEYKRESVSSRQL